MIDPWLYHKVVLLDAFDNDDSGAAQISIINRKQSS